jgi:hypothetical protein
MLETWFLLLEYRSTLLPKLSIGLKGRSKCSGFILGNRERSLQRKR